MMFQFDSMAAFTAMGGHGFYIWLSYLVTTLIMAWLVANPLLRNRQLFKVVKRQQARQNPHQGAVNTGSRENLP